VQTHAVGGAEALLEGFEHFLSLVERGIDQATRRVLRGEQVPATEKLLSLFEEHTQIITRHKARKPREFGRKVLIDEVEGGIISRYEVLSESASERSHLPESLRAHQEYFGRAPYLLAGDRGLYSVENEKAAHPDLLGVPSALAGTNVGHVDRGADASAPLPDASYPPTPAEEVQETDRHPVNAYLLTMLLLACSFGASVSMMVLINARKQGATCSWIGDDRRWLAVAYKEPSFLGVFRL
jgi:hypothetical protein